MITDFASLKAEARARCSGQTLAVVAATDEASIVAAMGARAEGLADSILIGQASRIRPLLEAFGADLAEFPVEDVEGDAAAADRGAELAATGRASVIVKGQVSSAEVIRAVLSRRHGLRTGRVLSDLRLYEHPFKPGHFLGLTDGGVIPLPSLEQKQGILENALGVYHRLGFASPAVALLAASEKVSPSIPHTGESRILAERAARGVIKGCTVDGPLSLDLALCPAASRLKGYASDVAGHAEILVGPNIETINVLAKAMVIFAGYVPGQVVVGARVPVLIPSRSDVPEVKIRSVAIACLF